jgi:type IV pilus assembly protein PilP
MMRKMEWRVPSVALLAALLVAGCGSSESRFADIDAFIQEVESRPKRPVEPLPEFKPYEAYAYSAAGMRSPFEPPAPPRPPRLAGEEQVEPDPNRVKQFLEQFPVTSLSMVGTLERDGEWYALIRDGDGAVHRVTDGDYMGMNHGEILAITENAIELDEIVPDGVGGWIKRSRTVRLAGSGG